MEIYTIGFTRKSAREFFSTLNDHGIKRLIDVRLNNASQLAGFSKKDDLAYFVQEILQAEYRHEPLLAPTQDMLTAYRQKGRRGWPDYEQRFRQLMQERRIETILDARSFETPTVLLCSEPSQDTCHRRLIVEYLDSVWGDVRSVPL
jgi:uncharacterized protein (DUF488 family)